MPLSVFPSFAHLMFAYSSLTSLHVSWRYTPRWSITIIAKGIRSTPRSLWLLFTEMDFTMEINALTMSLTNVFALSYTGFGNLTTSANLPNLRNPVFWTSPIFLVMPLFSGLTALIFQNRFVISPILCNFGKKSNSSLYKGSSEDWEKSGLRFGNCSQFYVLLRIAFNEHPTLSHQPFLWLAVGCKGIKTIWNSQIFLSF